jgi:hypothetical protein
MAITSAVCSSFKQELLQGKHDFDSSGGDTFKIALYTSSATLGAATTDYSVTNEITNTCRICLRCRWCYINKCWSIFIFNNCIYRFFDDVSYSSASFTANGALIYNTTTDGGTGTTEAVCVIAFGGDKTATNGTFTIQFPSSRR